MNARTNILLTCLLAIALAIPGVALAKDNDIDQEYLKAKVENSEENVNNEWDSYQYADHGSSLSAANCQLVVAAEVSIAALAATSALGIVNDEDEVVITATPSENGNHGFRDSLDAENSSSTCTTPIGPVLIDLTTTGGWGSASPHGTLSDAMLALSGGHRGGGGGPQNDIDQEHIKTSVELDDNVHNEWYSDQQTGEGGNSAVSAANCQAIIAARVSVLAVALAGAEASIEDSDQVAITGAQGLGASDVGFSEIEGADSTTLTIENNHTSTSSCLQSIDSITILIRPDTTTLPPRS